MPRKYVHTKSIGPYHLSARTINKEWFRLSMDEVWVIFSTHLPFLKFAFNFEIHAFVLMSNHYHLIVSTPELNLSAGMSYFQREVSRELNRRGNRINRNFAGRYFKCHLGKQHYFLNCYKYVYQNPVKSGLVKRCEDYRFSTLHGLIGQSHLMIPTVNDFMLFDINKCVESNLKWLNTLASEEDWESMRTALKKGEFKLRKDLTTKKANRLETKLI